MFITNCNSKTNFAKQYMYNLAYIIGIASGGGVADTNIIHTPTALMVHLVSHPYGGKIKWPQFQATVHSALKQIVIKVKVNVQALPSNCLHIKLT